ncbi:hypothetical protein JK159_03390 [Weissella minor]|uniref:phage tail tip lysozyme n=1 Tax=Weissella minor TaxID=1620 RepID=UPI001BAE76F9|nr:phage tail tip lysozyme [Weissella minor]MBS0949426.1 hypothetical protein [Weissella minor]
MQNLENTTGKKIALATAMIGMGLVGTSDVKADEIKQHVSTTVSREQSISRKTTVRPESTVLPSAIQIKSKNKPDLKQQPSVKVVQAKTKSTDGSKTGDQHVPGTKTNASKVAHTGTKSKQVGHGNQKPISRQVQATKNSSMANTIEQNEQLQSRPSDKQRVEKKRLPQADKVKKETKPVAKQLDDKKRPVGQKGQLQHQTADKHRSEAKALPQTPKVKKETNPVSIQTTDRVKSIRKRSIESNLNKGLPADYVPKDYHYSVTQEQNARYLYQFFSERGWTRNAIAGMLGNMMVESYLLPDITEFGGGGGYGLVQWTPADKLINWAKENGYDHRTLFAQSMRIQYEMTHGIQFYPSSAYPINATQYMQSQDSAYQLAKVFLSNYERPFESNQPERGNIAMYWYHFLEPKKTKKNVVQGSKRAIPKRKQGYAFTNGAWYYYQNGKPISGFRKFGQNMLEYCRVSDHTQVRNNYVQVGENVYYFNGKGDAISGFRKFDQNMLEYYRVSDHTQVRNNYVQVGAKVYYFNGEGDAISGFRNFGQNMLEYYRPSDHTQVRNNYVQVGAKVYYFNGEGDAISGLHRVNQKRLEYYDGKHHTRVQNGVVRLKQGEYYFDKTGKAMGGLYQHAPGKIALYHPNLFVRMKQPGYHAIKNSYVYLNSKGDVVTGFRKYGKFGLEYYDLKTGIQKRNQHLTIVGKHYFFNKNGDAVGGWQKFGKRDMYFDLKTHAAVQKMLLKIGKINYYFDANGFATRRG